MISDDTSPTECSIQLGEQNRGGRALQEINEQIYSSQNLKRVLVELQDRILGLLQADRMTIYVVDVSTKEIYSRFKIGSEVKRLIQLNRPTREIRNQARKDGMRTLKQDGIRKVLKGLTDISEVRKVCIK